MDRLLGATSKNSPETKNVPEFEPTEEVQSSAPRPTIMEDLADSRAVSHSGGVWQNQTLISGRDDSHLESFDLRLNMRVDAPRREERVYQRVDRIPKRKSVQHRSRRGLRDRPSELLTFAGSATPVRALSTASRSKEPRPLESQTQISPSRRGKSPAGRSGELDKQLSNSANWKRDWLIFKCNP